MESEREGRLDRILDMDIENREALNLQMLKYAHTMMFEQAQSVVTSSFLFACVILLLAFMYLWKTISVFSREQEQ